MTEIKIPKIIFQTWKTKNVPEHWKPSVDAYKRIMSDWTHILMTDEDNRNFVAEHYPYFLETYDAFPHNIQRVDAARVCYLHFFGGIYSDLDLMPRKTLDELFTEDADLFLVASANFTDYYTNAFMAAKPKHPLFLRYIEEMMKPVKPYAIGKHLQVMLTTGPMAFTRTIKQARKEGMELKIFRMPDNFLSGCTVCDAKPCVIPDSYMATLEGSSWIGNDSRCYNFFYCNWKKIILVVIIIIVILFFFYRTRKQSTYQYDY